MKQSLSLENVNIIHGYFDAVAKTWDKEIDILHIDGLHDYSAVKSDYLLWEKFVKASGTIMFHDTCVPSFGVRQLFDEITLPKVNFRNSHGLGVVSADCRLILDIACTFECLIEPGTLQVGDSSRDAKLKAQTA